MANTFGQRLRDLARSRMAVIAVAWVVALAASGLLYLWTPQFAGVPAQVEIVDYNVAAPETLRIVALPVEVGTPVRKGDVVASLDPVPLTLERDVVRAELDLRTAEVRFRQVTDDRSFADAVARAEQARALEDVDAKRVEADLQATRRRLAWWKAQVAAGTAPGREVEDLATDEASLARRLQSHRDAIAALTAQVKDGRERMAAWRGATGKESTAGGAGEADQARAAMRVAEARLALLDSRLKALTLRAPADGVVQRVNARPGDVSQAGQTVVLIREDIPKRVFAYPSASQAALLRVGTRAWVAARDTGGSDRYPAHVVAIGPGLVPFPEALQNRTTALNAWGQAVILRLDGPTPLAPGQVVDVSLLKVDEAILRDPEATASPAPAPVDAPAAPSLITVPESLARATRLEPSGLAWVPERDRYLVASDDTGLPDRDDHAPWVFWMDRNGVLDPAPAVLEGAPDVSDLESVARTSDGRFWLLASQSVSRKGHRPDDRTWLMRLDLRDGRLVEAGHASLAAALQALGPDRLAGLGLARSDPALRPSRHAGAGEAFDRVLNIEGLAADGNALLVGLKLPRDDRDRAVLWRIADPATLVATGRFAPDDPSPWGRLSLVLGEGADAEPAGISDLASLPGGGLAVLGTAPPGSRLGDRGAVWVIPGPLDPANLRPVKVREFPGLKPEGVSVGPTPGEVTIVFDEGARAPHWVRVPVPR